jgi:arylsulfatase A-like enzyme
MLLILLTGLLSCEADGDGGPQDSSASSDTSTASRRIVLLTLDTIRADHVTLETMPWLTGLASEGLVWTNTWGESWTYSAIGEILSARNPATWGIDSYDHENEGSGPAQIGDDVRLLAEELTDRGWATAFWSSNDVAGSATNLHRGYGLAELFSEGKTEAVIPEIVQWSKDNAGTDQLIHLHVNDAHDPYDLVAESCAEAVAALPVDECRYDFASLEKKDTIHASDDIARGQWGASSSDYEACREVILGEYGCEVRYQDDALAASWDLLNEGGVLDGAIVVIALDHGEGMLDPWANHAFDIRSTTTRNWVMFWAPGVVTPGEWDAPMGQDDIVPSLEFILGDDFGLESTGMPWMDATEDRVITGYWMGLPPTQPTEVNRHYAYGNGFQYIRASDGVEMLYDVNADPNEQTDLIGTVEVPAALSAAIDAQELLTVDYPNQGR